VYFEPTDIDQSGTSGRITDRLYRRVKMNTRYAGIVRYPRELEALVDDVRVYVGERDRAVCTARQLVSHVVTRHPFHPHDAGGAGP
jgi:hypothetical protein